MIVEFGRNIDVGTEAAPQPQIESVIVTDIEPLPVKLVSQANNIVVVKRGIYKVTETHVHVYTYTINELIMITFYEVLTGGYQIGYRKVDQYGTPLESEGSAFATSPDLTKLTLVI